jgi:hypothetical protein
MAQSISNTTPTRYGGNTISAPGSKPKPTTKVQWGLPQSNTPLFPSLTGTANSTTSTTTPPSPVTRGSIPYQIPQNQPAAAAPSKAATPAATPGLVSRPSNSNANTIKLLDEIKNRATALRDNGSPAAKNAEETEKTKAKLDNTPVETKKGLFPDVLSSLRTASNPNAMQQANLQKLMDAAAGNKDIADEAARISRQYGDEIARVGGLGAGAVAGAQSTGTSIVGAGNAAIASQSASARMSALSQAQQAALAGTAQQLQGQQQTAGAYGQALSGANVQQGQQITGLTNTAQFAQPVQIAPGSTLASPVTGEQVAGGLGGYADYRTAEQVMSLISQYPDVNYVYDQTKTPQQNLQQLQQAIQSSPVYQRSVYGVPGQNSIAGATAVQTAQSGYQGAYQEYNDLLTRKSNAEQLSQNLSAVMQQYGINPTEARFANAKIKDLRRQFNAEGQAAFDTALKELQAAYSNLLITGGGLTPTEASATETLINPDADLNAIMASINQLKLAGETRVRVAGDKVTTYANQLPGPTANTSAGGNIFAESWDF